MALVLVLEDDEQVRVLAEAILQEAGHATLSAGSVEDARALLDGGQAIEALFTDVALGSHPDGGLEIAKEAVGRQPGLAVVYTTGKGITDGMRARFVERFTFVPKPYKPDDLTAAVDNVLHPRWADVGSNVIPIKSR